MPNPTSRWQYIRAYKGKILVLSENGTAFPRGWIYKAAELNGSSMAWLRLGRSQQYRVDFGTADLQRLNLIHGKPPGWRLQRFTQKQQRTAVET